MGLSGAFSTIAKRLKSRTKHRGLVDREHYSTIWRSASLGRAADDAIGGGDIAAASRGEMHPVLVFIEGTDGYVCVEGLHHCQASVPVVVDVVP